jgi:integrase
VSASKARGGKRGNNEGSVYQRSDGKWCAAVTLSNGKRKVLYGRTRQDVARKLTEALQAREQGMPVSLKRQTVGQFLHRWLEDAVKPNVRPRTYLSYSQLVRLHLRPSLGRVQLAQLAPHDVQAFLNQKGAAGLSPRTVQYIRAVLRRALGQALKWGLVVRNVATLVDPPRVERHEVEPLTTEQAMALLAAARGNRLEALYSVALAIGLRQGEALGLRWVDIDLDAGTLRVRKQLQRIDGTLQLTEPKTDRSRRLIVLPAFAVDSLREHRLRQLQERLLAGTRWQDHGLVFPSTIGTPLEPRNLLRQFHAMLGRAGLQRCRFQDLRHTCATLLLIQGEDLRVVMDVLGHSQISLTANTYQHVREALKRAADKMQALFATQR